MHIEKFVAARKNAGLSQIELAQGICTQATLSRFEKKGQVPSLKILLQLCERLNFPVGELFPKIGVKQTKLIETFTEIEFLLITMEYEKAQKMLTDILPSELDTHELQMRYHYLSGFLLYSQKAPTFEVLFAFNQLLLGDQEDSLYQLLAYTGMGLVYVKADEKDKAEIFFDKVLRKIYDYPVKTIEETWRVLHILYQCGVFYSEIGEYEVGNTLLEYAITICSDNHITFYLARVATQLACNAMKLNMPKVEILERLTDARAYAKINRNERELRVISQLLQEVN
ncbi:transcriptional regulator [Enterococcus saigonensis]|uniref:Transcriptional regulator n=1 Tax=Enterococcus saigonensis TaxID=1805431 RepID=A0A679ILM9_9ENTE|nr:helix-turn-helix transcriptional regulator [Enterococcus saigonensis]BCA86465.1 transcriptional regulator [Enterococcus saigonensis]